MSDCVTQDCLGEGGTGLKTGWAGSRGQGGRSLSLQQFWNRILPGQQWRCMGAALRTSLVVQPWGLSMLWDLFQWLGRRRRVAVLGGVPRAGLSALLQGSFRMKLWLLFSSLRPIRMRETLQGTGAPTLHSRPWNLSPPPALCHLSSWGSTNGTQLEDTKGSVAYGSPGTPSISRPSPQLPLPSGCHPWPSPGPQPARSCRPRWQSYSGDQGCSWAASRPTGWGSGPDRCRSLGLLARPPSSLVSNDII